LQRFQETFKEVGFRGGEAVDDGICEGPVEELLFNLGGLFLEPVKVSY
jgi:hypothetical protein